MSNEKEPVIFISYRRQDSAAAARWLLTAIQRTFGLTSVFMDIETIRSGDDWQAQINESLKTATVLIAVIGLNWLRLTDPYGRRRIDGEDDWVRKEIAYALDNQIKIIPLLLSRIPIPEKAALPENLQRLTNLQGFELREERWENDIKSLLSELEELGFKRKTTRSIRYPKPCVNLQDLSQKELTKALEKLPEWEVVVSDIPGSEPSKRIEFKKVYEFTSFEDAIDFINTASKYVTEVQHHPRWENIWRTVTVWLSSWDIGHKPSNLDLEMAEFMDILYKNYRSPKNREIGKQ